MAKITEFQDGMRCTYSDIEDMLREMNTNSPLPTRYQEMKEALPKCTYKDIKKEKSKSAKKEKKPDYEVRFTMKGLDQKIGCADRAEVVKHVQAMRHKHGVALKIELFFKGKNVGTL